MRDEEKLYYFKSLDEIRRWFKKNYLKKNLVWIVFNKKSLKKSSFSAVEASDIAMCYGWCGIIVAKVDVFTYKVKYMKRKPKGTWSFLSIKKFKNLKKQGLTTQFANKMFSLRDKSKSEESLPKFSNKDLLQFKKNKIAWDFFNMQTPSYQKYTTQWVASAKTQKTHDKRLTELINDSQEQTKLKRILEAQYKYQNRHEPGKTPIENAKNLGAVTGVELRSIGFDTVEKLKKAGWEEVFTKLVEVYPNRLNLNMVVGLAAACEDQHWQRLDPELKIRAKNLLLELKESYKF